MDQRDAGHALQSEGGPLGSGARTDGQGVSAEEVGYQAATGQGPLAVEEGQQQVRLNQQRRSPSTQLTESPLYFRERDMQTWGWQVVKLCSK